MTCTSLQRAALLVALLSATLAAPAGAQTRIIENQTFEDWEASGEAPITLGPEDAGVIIRNCVFRNGESSAIVLSGARDVVIENNRFENITTDELGKDVVAISCGRACQDITIQGNTFVDIGADGFQAGHRGENIRDIRITGNHFYRTHEVGGENGVDLKHVQGPVLVAGNFFHGFRPCTPDEEPGCGGSGGVAMVLHLGATGVTIEDNTFYDNTIGLRVFRHEAKTPPDPRGFVALPPTDIIIRGNRFIENLKQGVVVDEAKNVEVSGNIFVGDQASRSLTCVPYGGGRCEKDNVFVGPVVSR